MGYALAETLHNLGADVYLVRGPVTISTIFPVEKISYVSTGKQMYEECKLIFKKVDIAIFCAAVADYTPKVTSDIKIKKIEDETTLILEKNPDIAFEFGKIKTEKQKAIGFALETNNIIENAIGKLKRKKFDFIVVNSPNKNEGFGYDTNKINIL